MLGVDRWRDRLVLLVQGGLAAGAAWWVATVVLGHRVPFFAPVAALLVLGISHAQRTQRARQVAVGVAIGVGVGDIGVHLLGSGVWQLALFVFVSMSLATLVNAGPTITVQAGVQTLIVTTMSTGAAEGVDRWIDALVGCLLALGVASLTPIDLVTPSRLQTARLLDRVTETLRVMSGALVNVDRDRLLPAHALLAICQREVAGLAETSREARSAARHSLRRSRALRLVAPWSRLPRIMERLVGDVDLLVRRVDIALWRKEPVSRECRILVEDLADAVDLMAGELWNRRLPTTARQRLVLLAARTSSLPVTDSLSASVVVAQLRSVVADLLMVTGLDLDEARTAIPDMVTEP